MKLNKILSLLFLIRNATARKDIEVGPRDRFWRHHIEQKILLDKYGENQYENILSCLDTELTDEDREMLKTWEADSYPGTMIEDAYDRVAVLVVVRDAFLPIHVKAVQSLASCVRQYMPYLYESRAMYQEMNLDEDIYDMGGNCPTHLAPLVSVFLPEVVDQMFRVLKIGYDVAEWINIVEYEEELNLPRFVALPLPEDVGFRASEHLTYKDFPGLNDHHDGEATAYTLNFAFSDEYEGGEFYIMIGEEDDAQKVWVKPKKYDAMVFLGGRYSHGVEPIISGHREMFSSELWAYPDIPFGSNLWTATPENIEEFITKCNEEGEEVCRNNQDFSTVTASGVSMDEVKKKYAHTVEDEKEQQTKVVESEK